MSVVKVSRVSSGAANFLTINKEIVTSSIYYLNDYLILDPIRFRIETINHNL